MSRIGDILIASTPTETYALTGLKLKLQSLLPKTMVIELANGGDGYIPPPEQHALGGYNSWPARSAGLEVQAEPKITEAALQLLGEVADRARHDHSQDLGPAAQAIMDTQPAVYCRMHEFSGPYAIDSRGDRRDAIYEEVSYSSSKALGPTALRYMAKRIVQPILLAGECSRESPTWAAITRFQCGFGMACR